MANPRLIHWFGEAWDAPVCDPEQRVDVPTRERCARCTLAFDEAAQGFAVPYIDPIAFELSLRTTQASGEDVAKAEQDLSDLGVWPGEFVYFHRACFMEVIRAGDAPAPGSAPAYAKPQLDRIAEQLTAWLRDQSWEPDDFALTFEVNPQSPWVLVDAKPNRPVFEGELPEELSFAVWRQTGAIHRCEHGEVQDPALTIPAPPS